MENIWVSDTKKTGSALPESRYKTIFLAAFLLLSACSGSQDQAEIGQCQNSKKVASAIEPLIGGELAAFNLSAAPQKMPLLEFVNDKGEKTNTASLGGKAVLFNLWATWCAPCRKEMPAFGELQREFGGTDFAVAAINVDRGGPGKPKNFLKEIGVDNLDYYQDETMGVFNALKKQSLAFGLPVTMLLDKEGCIIGALNGEAKWAGDEAKAMVKAAMEAGK